MDFADRVAQIRAEVNLPEGNFPTGVGRAKRGPKLGPIEPRPLSDAFLAGGADDRIVRHIRTKNPHPLRAFLESLAERGSLRFAGVADLNDDTALGLARGTTGGVEKGQENLIAAGR